MENLSIIILDILHSMHSNWKFQKFKPFSNSFYSYEILNANIIKEFLTLLSIPIDENLRVVFKEYYLGNVNSFHIKQQNALGNF